MLFLRGENTIAGRLAVRGRLWLRDEHLARRKPIAFKEGSDHRAYQKLLKYRDIGMETEDGRTLEMIIWFNSFTKRGESGIDEAQKHIDANKPDVIPKA